MDVSVLRKLGLADPVANSICELREARLRKTS